VYMTHIAGLGAGVRKKTGQTGLKTILFICKKGKAVPLQARRGPEGSRKLNFPDLMTMAHNGGKVLSFTHRPSLPSRKCSWY